MCFDIASYYLVSYLKPYAPSETRNAPCQTPTQYLEKGKGV